MDSSVLIHLLSAGDFERTISQGKLILQQDPTDRVAHYSLGYAYLAIGQTANAQPHVQFVLSNTPDEADSHVLGLLYFKAIGDRRKAAWHCEEGRRLDPDKAIFYFFAAQEEAGKYNLTEAKHLIDRAIELAPDDPDYHHFAIQLEGVTNNRLTSSWEQIERLKETLRLAPENAAIYHSIGEIYLDEIRDARQAEAFFRDALRLSPMNTSFQRSLFQAVSQRDLLFRVLSIPARACGWIAILATLIAIQPWRIILVVLLFKGVIAGAIWLLVVSVLFWPAAKIYEWLVLSEIRDGGKKSLRSLRVWFWIHRWPLLLRLPVCIGLIFLVYGLCLSSLRAPCWLIDLIIAFVCLHVSFVLVEIGYMKCRNWVTKKFHDSQQSNSGQPAIVTAERRL